MHGNQLTTSKIQPCFWVKNRLFFAASRAIFEIKNIVDRHVKEHADVFVYITKRSDEYLCDVWDWAWLIALEHRVWRVRSTGIAGSGAPGSGIHGSGAPGGGIPGSGAPEVSIIMILSYYLAVED